MGRVKAETYTTMPIVMIYSGLLFPVFQKSQKVIEKRQWETDKAVGVEQVKKFVSGGKSGRI